MLTSLSRSTPSQDVVLLQICGDVETFAAIAPALSQIWRCACPSVIQTLIQQRQRTI